MALEYHQISELVGKGCVVGSVIFGKGALHNLLQVYGVCSGDNIRCLVVGRLSVVVDFKVDKMQVFNHELVFHAAVSTEVFRERLAWEVGRIPIVRLCEVVAQSDGDLLMILRA